MIMLRRFEILIVLVLLGACSQFPVCPSPGGVTKKECYYELTITKAKDERIGLPMGKVAQYTLEKNSTRKTALWSYEWSEDYKPADYPVVEYPLYFEDPDLINKLELKLGKAPDGKDYWYAFVNVPGTPYLKRCDEACKERRIKELYSKDEKWKEFIHLAKVHSKETEETPIK